MKIILIPGQGVSIILIIRSNMLCINVLFVYNLFMGRKFGVCLHVRLKSLLHLIWNVECRRI